MVENLRLGQKGKTMTLTSADSDVSANFTLPASAEANFTGTDNNAVFVSAEYGGYYSWFTATAGTGKADMASGNAASSICPKGWRLPTGGSGGEYEVMAKKYGNGTDQATSTALQATPFSNFIFSGVYRVGSVALEQGSYGEYWSSTAGAKRRSSAASGGKRFGYNSGLSGSKNIRDRQLL